MHWDYLISRFSVEPHRGWNAMHYGNQALYIASAIVLLASLLVLFNPPGASSALLSFIHPTNGPLDTKTLKTLFWTEIVGTKDGVEGGSSATALASVFVACASMVYLFGYQVLQLGKVELKRADP